MSAHDQASLKGAHTDEFTPARRSNRQTDHTNEYPTETPQTPVPHPRLRDLDVLEGTWRLEGSDLDGANPFTGTVTRRWLPGGRFLVQEMSVGGQEHGGTEYIGFDHARGSLRSMLFSNEGPGPFCSFALEYYWQVAGDELTIWHGEEGSPARFIGTIDRSVGVVDGRWEWPGGGYRATSTRMAHPPRHDETSAKAGDGDEGPSDRTSA